METSIVTPDNSKLLTVILRREISRMSYSTDNRSTRVFFYSLLVEDSGYEWSTTADRGARGL